MKQLLLDPSVLGLSGPGDVVGLDVKVALME